MLNLLAVEDIVRSALLEDLQQGDITSAAVVDPQDEGRAEIVTREEGIIGGLPVAAIAFRLSSPGSRLELLVQDGARVKPGVAVASVEGPLLSILGGERVALNFLQRVSGIATMTSRFVEKTGPYRARICDTRKTVPGLRLLDKYAVRLGGGVNHRFGLGDAVLLKDNHIVAAGGILEAVRRVRESLPLTAKVEVEVETLKQVDEALTAGVDIIMLDNMDPAEMRKAVEVIGGRAIVEASGGVKLDKVDVIAATGVDFISVGALTHSVPAFDLSLELLG